jgi:hypothetical protein
LPVQGQPVIHSETISNKEMKKRKKKKKLGRKRGRERKKKILHCLP